MSHTTLTPNGPLRQGIRSAADGCPVVRHIHGVCGKMAPSNLEAAGEPRPYLSLDRSRFMSGLGSGGRLLRTCFFGGLRGRSGAKCEG